MQAGELERPQGHGSHVLGLCCLLRMAHVPGARVRRWPWCPLPGRLNLLTCGWATGWHRCQGTLVHSWSLLFGGVLSDEAAGSEGWHE